MSTRLATGGRLIDRTRPVNFRFNSRRLKGYAGDTLASALLANDQVMMGRSFKYHRPRGLLASGAEEPNALMGLGQGGRFEPNQRATTQELFEGLKAESQNHWPSLEFDIGAINAKLSRFLPAGFYYKTFMAPRAAWKHLFEPVIRQSAGLGKVPQEPDADTYEHIYLYCDVLVAGGGMAGLAAALAAGKSGLRVVLMEQAAHLGGRALVDDVTIGDLDGPAWVEETVQALEAMENVSILRRCMVAGVYDHGYALGYERLGDHGETGGPRHRLWRVRARRIVSATGAIERPLPFAGNDIPGVMLASAVRDYVALWAVSPGDRTVVVTNNDDAYRTALALKAAGLDVPAIVDARTVADGQLAREARALGIRVLPGTAIASVKGGRRVTSVTLCPHAGEGGVIEEIPCDCVAMSGGWSPVVHLWSHCGGKLRWNEEQALFAPDPDRPPLGHDGTGFVLAAGSASGALLAPACFLDASAAGRRAAEEAGASALTDEAAPSVGAPPEEPILPVWSMPQGATAELRAKAFLDYQNDVKLSDVRLAAREGYESVEHTKRYTTLGMATDQGKTSNINGLATLAAALNKPIDQVGTTTFRPPYTPISLGAIAGAARDGLFKPLRKTPIDPWLERHGAAWEPVGDWRRPYCIPRSGESRHDAVTREVLATRQGVGLLDASTLGKLLVKGPDAAKFLDLVYTNVMSNLKPGACRYGLMCTEQGFLFDDGVVLRIDEETFLCHTTSGGADRVHGWLEEWLQTEWWDFKVYVANLTEQFAQVAIAGPRARDVLEAIGGADVSRDKLPFMRFVDGELAGIPARIMRISFTGELSFEVAVPASRGLEFWQHCLDQGRRFGVTPFGTEALHVMRAEKGFIMVGDETDGTVIPQDLGLGWAVSKKKADFIGKRGQEREDLSRPGRKQLVGLLTEDPMEVLPDGAHAVTGDVTAFGHRRTIGHVTSTYFSPTLGHSIAMALIEGGQGRMGEVLDIPVSKVKTVKARVVDPVFYDKEGARQDV